MRNYHELLPYAFKRFSILTARRTALPTAWYYLRHPALSASDKPALFTMNILPPMMTVWHHLARKALGDAVDMMAFDCSGKLDPKDFPGMRIQKFINLYAATKCDEFLYSVARKRRYGWLCDDDVFFAGPQALTALQREFSVEKTASVSFRSREWWYYEIDGKQYETSGSYCIAYDRSIFCDREKLSLAPANGNTHPTRIGKKERRYDTGDLSNELLIRRGYRCAIVDHKEQDDCILPFTGLSGGVVLLDYFKTPDQVLSYLSTPPLERWTGNVLHRILGALLSITTIQECYREITGTTYPLPSLPTRTELEDLRRSREPHLREDLSFTPIDEVSERLKKLL